MTTLVASDRVTQRIHVLERLAATAIAMRAVELEVEDEGSRSLLHDALSELRFTIAELRDLLGPEHQQDDPSGASDQADGSAPESDEEDPVVVMVRERMRHK